jgi:hypothetical protein
VGQAAIKRVETNEQQLFAGLDEMYLVGLYHSVNRTRTDVRKLCRFVDRNQLNQLTARFTPRASVSGAPAYYQQALDLDRELHNGVLPSPHDCS